ncbi:MAG: ATP-binding protein [Desulfosarcinaceae bacterium]
MSWVTDAGATVEVGNISFVVGSTVFYTSLLLSVFVVYAFDGPKMTRIAISTVLCVSILTPLVAAILHLQAQYLGTAHLARIPVPDLRINTASAAATLIDLIFLAMAWEFLGKQGFKLRLWLRAYGTLLGVMWLDVLLFATGAFAGTAAYFNIMKGTLISRFLISLLAFPFLYVYLFWQNREKGVAFENRPVLAILKRFAETETELSNIRQEMNRRIAAEEALQKYRGQLEKQVAERTRELTAAKREWESTFDAISDWVCIVDQEYRIIRSNKASLALFGLSPTDIIGKHCYDVVKSAGHSFPDCPLGKAFENRQHVTMEFKARDGRWYQMLIDPMEGDYEKERFVHIVRDISDLKEKEREVLLARKAEAFSILSGGIAHDYNNLLSVIWGNISLWRDDIGAPEVNDLLDEAEKACAQAKSLTHQFITLSQGAGLRKSIHSVGGLLSAVLKEVDVPENIQVTVDVPQSIPIVEVDADLMGVALKNIIENAVEAMPSEGVLEIRALKDASKPENSSPAGSLVLVFADSGCGIPAAELPNVFDPYFSTKELGTRKGMGLGLAVTKSVLLKHGGHIHMESVPGRGTSVMVTLPLPDLSVPGAADGFSARAGANPTVLVMEDNRSMRKLCEKMLERLNCSVISAGHGKEALEKYELAADQGAAIALILLDENIKGGISGSETLKKLKAIGYSNPAVVVSGSPNSPAMMNDQKFGFDGMLLKPFTKKELEEILERFIEG